METEEIIETTLGDLIVALTEVATSVARDEKEGHKMVAFLLMDLLNSSGMSLRRRQFWH